MLYAFFFLLRVYHNICTYLREGNRDGKRGCQKSEFEVPHNMAPKVDTSDPRIQKLLEQFATISFTGQKANETLRNAKTSDTLSTLIEKNQLSNKGLDAKKGQLIVSAATVAPPTLDLEKRSYIVQRILDGSLDSADRINEAGKFLANVSDINNVEKAALDKACGVGEYLMR